MEHVPLVPAASARRAPTWDVAMWLGTPSPLESLGGKVVVLHAFQMLCPGCVAHGLPQAAGIFRSFDRMDVAVVGLHTVFEHHDAMRPVSLTAFLHEYRVPFPVGVDAHTPGDPVPRTMAAYGLRGTPSLVLIDRRGRLRANLFGRPSDLAVGAAVASLVAEGASRDRGASPAASDCDDEGCTVPPRVG